MMAITTGSSIRSCGCGNARESRDGSKPPAAPNSHCVARDAKNQVAMLRAEADELRNLPVNDVARLIEAKRADQEQQ